MTPTRALAEFVAEQPNSSIPAEAKTMARLAITDCIASALTGTLEPIGPIVRSYVGRLGGSPEATVIAGGFRTSPQDAAFANGAVAHTTDFDDMCYPARVHPSVTLVPAALALGEALHRTGDEILCAYVLGFEVLYRIGREIGAELDRQCWHTTGVYGPIAAAAVAARLVQLDADKTAIAMGIGASGAGGLGAQRGTMARPLHAGSCGRHGVTAALLAKEDFTAAGDVLENSRGGFFQNYSRTGDYDLQKLTEGLGTSFAVASGGLEFKPYPSVGFTHWAIDATLELVGEDDFSVDEIAEVHCATNSRLQVERLAYHSPQSSLEAKFSMHYSIAAALLYRGVGPRDFTEEAIRRPEIQDLMRRITFDVLPGAEAGDDRADRGIVTVRLTDGRVLAREVERTPDRLTHEMSESELASKYRACASMAMVPSDVEASLRYLEGFGDLEEIGPLMDILSRAESLQPR